MLGGEPTRREQRRSMSHPCERNAFGGLVCLPDGRENTSRCVLKLHGCAKDVPLLQLCSQAASGAYVSVVISPASIYDGGSFYEALDKSPGLGSPRSNRSMRVGCLLLAVTATSALNAHALLRPVTVLRAVDGSQVTLTDQWAADERAVVVLMRSFG